MDTLNERKLNLFQVSIFPLIFVLSFVVVKLIEVQFDVSFVKYGLNPRELSGLIGILTSPFIHSGWEHLFNNSVPIFVLSSAVFYFYKEIAWKVIGYSTLITGIWVWVFARPSFHIGASGVVYALASFVFFSGVIRRHLRLIALSLIVVFMYGSLIWGIFPIDYTISWESHLMGGIAGLVIAYYFRNYGPQKEVIEWDDNEEETIPEAIWNPNYKPPEAKEEPIKPTRYIYTFKKKEDSKGS